MNNATFHQVAAQWKAVKRQYVKSATYSLYVTHLNCHILPSLGKVREIREGDIQKLADGMLQDGLSRKTVQDVMLVVKMVVNYGAAKGAWLPVSYKVHLPAKAQKQVSVLSRRHQVRLAEYLMENPSAKNIGLLLCLYSGMRIGEVCALQWADVDFQSKEIHVRKTVQRLWLRDGKEKDSRVIVGTPKTPSSVRDIPLTQELTRQLRALREGVPNYCYMVSGKDVPLEPRYYRDYFKRVLRQLGIPQVRFHALRHSFATRCIESGCDYKTLSAILGHASIATTMDIYVHPSYADKKRAIEKMARSCILSNN